MDSLVCLRNIDLDELPRIYEFQLDSESNRMAVTTPRSAEAFDAHWEIAFQDPNITARAITVGDVLAPEKIIDSQAGAAFHFLIALAPLWTESVPPASCKVYGTCIRMAPASVFARHVRQKSK